MRNLLSFFAIALVFVAIGCGHGPNDEGQTPSTPREPVKIPVYPKVEQPPLPPPPAPVVPAKKPDTILSEKWTQKGSLQGAEDTKVDILFVEDDSDSMKTDQNNISENVDKFVDVLLRNQKIDFNAAVTSVWDTFTYGDAVRKFKNGELRPVDPRKPNSARFIHNKDFKNTAELNATLKRYLKIGTQSFNKADPAHSGPQFEEIFSPILAALQLSKPDASAPNVNTGFFREGAHLAIILVTDSEDLTPHPSLLRAVANGEAMPTPSLDGNNLRAGEMSTLLRAAAQDAPSITVLGALARYDEMKEFDAAKLSGALEGSTAFEKPYHCQSLRSEICPYSVDPELWKPSVGPRQISNLIDLMGGEAFDLESKSFGDRFAKLGQKIVHNTLSYRVLLDYAADPGQPIVVKIQGKAIPEFDKARKSWNYKLADSGRTLVFSRELNLDQYDQFNYEISYTKLY